MHLIDAFMPLIAHVVELCSELEGEPPAYQQARGEVRRLLELCEASCRNFGFDQAAGDEARFAVCAWIDETILASTWMGKQQWQHDQLQRAYYQTAEAGVEVFERLERLQPEQRDLREVYFVCLALGFKGRYIKPGDDLLLEQLKVSNLKLLENLADLPPLDKIELFPGANEGHATPRGNHGARSFDVSPFTAVAVAAPVILFALLYLIYRFVLNGLALPVS